MKKITVLLPAYNEEDNIQSIKTAMNEVAEQNNAYEWEFLLVNDGSSDSTLAKICLLHEQDSRFSYIDLSRNYGKEIAMMAGFDYVTGDAVIIMDSDLQHPISVIPEMISYWEQGYDDVYAYRKSSEERWFKKMTSRWYYDVLQKMTKIPIQKNTGDFRLLDRTCIDALRKMRETQRNTKGMYSWIGFNKKGIPYKQLTRKAGKSKWRPLQLVSLAVDGITSYTTVPLKIASIFGVLVSLIAFAYLIYIIITTMFFGESVQGYPTIMVTILFIGGVQLLSLGVIGEYLGRVFNESKNRPGYFINSYNGKKDKENEYPKK